MIKTFTQHDLVQYLYNELPKKRRLALEEALMVDQELAECCADLLLTQLSLEKALTQPSDRVTNAIISYSKTVSLHP
ncbi:hypothetical protein EFA69_04720 [Rufibacter immobilis]|uniref:Anti-sigma factor n=1 Tax=Rufibacter immobilis TaxID=1348778 RepID=A0A3M9N5F4_9BACT|nr:hypothetical protein [Rufibacter immobilis]RNI32625.1 hypothetical protein EFA69_04720 [Rufibacter immobilis]